MTQAQFRSLFVAGPLLLAAIVPTLLFAALYNEWGTNLVWGSYFGLMWCLSAHATGGLLRGGEGMLVGLLWGWVALVPLYVAAGWLWQRIERRGRTIAISLLALSSLASVPAHTIMALDRQGFHLPDYSLHVAGSY